MSEKEVKGKKVNSTLAELLKDLKSGNETKVSGALKAFHQHGELIVIPEVIAEFSLGFSDANKALAKDLLQNIRETAAVSVFMDEYRKVENEQLRGTLTQIFWNSKLDFSAYLPDFILFAIDGDFMDAFEAYTLIGQFESQISESAILESQLLLKEYFGNDEIKDEKKLSILSDIALYLKDFDNQSEMDDLFI